MSAPGATRPQRPQSLGIRRTPHDRSANVVRHAIIALLIRTRRRFRKGSSYDPKVPIARMQHGDDHLRAVVPYKPKPVTERQRVEFGRIAEQVACSSVIVVAAETIGNGKPKPIAKNQRTLPRVHGRLRLKRTHRQSYNVETETKWVWSRRCWRTGRTARRPGVDVRRSRDNTPNRR